MVSSISTKQKYFNLKLIICLHTVNWFQVLLCNNNNVILVIICLCTLCYVIPIIKVRHTVKEFQDCFLILIIQVNITHLLAHS